MTRIRKLGKRFKVKLAFAILGMLTTGLTGVVAAATPAYACQHCGGYLTADSGAPTTYANIILNGTKMSYATYSQYILAGTHNAGQPTWSGSMDVTANYNLNWHYGPFASLTLTIASTKIGAHYAWGPGDHIQGYSSPIASVSYMTGGGCCFLSLHAHETLAYWYHLAGRNVDSGYKINTHFSIEQKLPGGLPAGQDDVHMWLELHGNGTQAWAGTGGSVAGFSSKYLP